MYKYRKESETTYCIGTTLTIEALSFAPKQMRKVYISPKQKKDQTYEKVVSLAKKSSVPVIFNNEKIFKEVSGKDNCMVLGEFEKFSSCLDGGKNHIVLVNPSNQGNLGTILRSCFGFYQQDIALITPCADPFDPKTVRASMGALFHLRIEFFPDFPSYQARFPEHRLHPFMLQADKLLKAADKTGPWSLVFGNEATGLDACFLRVGEPLLIPQNPALDSLNLDNAVSIVLYEFCR